MNRDTSDQIDADAVLAAHERWRAAQVGWDIDAARSCIVTGENLLQFNLNGQTYRNVDDLVLLWRGMEAQLALYDSQDLTRPEILVDGDLAVLSIERSVMRFRARETFAIDDGVGTITFEKDGTDIFFRSTEIYRKDDGTGRAEWRIWRAHYDRAAA